MRRNPDDTVIMKPAAPPARRAGRAIWTVAAVAVLIGMGLGVTAFRGGLPFVHAPAPPAAPPVPAALPIPDATEAAIIAESPAVRTVLRFAPNPAIVVLDFPTLAEQGQMLNRLAAWAEKSGVPHDRLLDDAGLAAAIRASGTTSATYYYGHDYAGGTVGRFFMLADAEHLVLDPEEQQLRQVAARAHATPGGFGALVTLPRADAANEVDVAARRAILHHELSHGEFFTNAVYASYVHTVWALVLTADERAAFRTYLSQEGYDPALEEVMLNEMQAYLMFTPDPRFFDPSRLGIPAARLAEIRASFVAGMPPGWLRESLLAQPAPVQSVLPRRGAVRRRRYGRVSSSSAVAATDPPRRRRVSIAA